MKVAPIRQQLKDQSVFLGIAGLLHLLLFSTKNRNGLAGLYLNQSLIHSLHSNYYSNHEFVRSY